MVPGKFYNILLGVVFIFVTCSFKNSLFVQNEAVKVLIRIDDIGMSHSVNMALSDLAATKMKLSASVMFACPWYQEAAEILKQNPQISVGKHLTLNSEWKYYKWGPVAGRDAVPSLVADDGYFYPSTTEFLESGFDINEVERELEAQIQRALSTGLKIDYVDFHMRTALATSELKELTVKLAEKHGLKRSMFSGETYKSLFSTDIDQKLPDLINHLKGNTDNHSVNLVIVHAARANPEMEALIDMNNADQRSDNDKPVVALNREAELKALLSAELKEIVKDKSITLINYGDL